MSNSNNQNLDDKTNDAADRIILPNVQAQRWTWLARDVLLGAQKVTDMAIRCSAWFGCIVFLFLLFWAAATLGGLGGNIGRALYDRIHTN